MSKNNIVQFPVDQEKKSKTKKIKNFNDNFCDNEGRQIFIKSFSNGDDRYLIPENIEHVEIQPDDNIVLPVINDTEFTDYTRNLENITTEFLEDNNDKFKLQYERQQRYLNHVQSKSLEILRKINLEDIASGLIKEVPKELLEKLQDCKMARNQLISSQFKHALHDDSVLFFNPKLKNLIGEHVGNKELFYKEKWHVLDYLKNKGFDVELKRMNPDLSRDEFKKNFGLNDNGSKRPTCTITIYAFFLLAELCKIFEGDLLEDIVTGFRRRKIQMNRRVSTGMIKKNSFLIG